MERLVGSLRLIGDCARVDKAAFDAALEHLWWSVQRPCGWFCADGRLEWNWCNGDAESCLWWLEQLAAHVFWPLGIGLSGSFSLVNGAGECMTVRLIDGARGLDRFYTVREPKFDELLSGL